MNKSNSAMIQVPESKLQSAVMVYRMHNDDEPEQYLKALETGKIYKEAVFKSPVKGYVFKDEGLTPFYVLDQITGEIIVTSEEAINNKFN